MLDNFHYSVEITYSFNNEKIKTVTLMLSRDRSIDTNKEIYLLMREYTGRTDFSIQKIASIKKDGKPYYP